MNKILPLLDGFDEIALTLSSEKSMAVRSTCIEAINAYREQHGFASIAITSRSAAYFALNTCFTVNQVITIRPLTKQQIDEYLSSTEKLKGVRLILSQNDELHQLAKIPLMLSIVTLTYYNAADDAVHTFETSQNHVFEAYLNHMLTRRNKSLLYDTKQTKHYLVWLAWQMRIHNQAVFYIDRMQPDWLSQGWARLVYYASVGSIGALLMGLLLAGLGIVVDSLFLGGVLGLIGGLLGGQVLRSPV